MFCPSCGAEYTIELKYCNRCGANLASPPALTTTVVPVDITKSVAAIGTTMAVLTLGGFAALITGAIALASKASMGNDPIIALVMMGMITILVSDVFLARQLSKLISASLSSRALPQPRRQSALPTAPPVYLQQQSVPGHLQGVPSVTENTTRFFEPENRAPAETKERVTSEKLDR